MNPLVFDYPPIMTEEETKRLGIDLSNLEKIATRETPLGFVYPELKESIRDSAKEQGASLVVITKEGCYGGLFVDKYQYTYDLYKKK
jgi:hypothetical protein